MTQICLSALCKPGQKTGRTWYIKRIINADGLVNDSGVLNKEAVLM